MVSLCGRGFDSLQLHYVAPSRGLTLVRVLSFAALDESGKAERDSLQLHFSRIEDMSEYQAHPLFFFYFSINQYSMCLVVRLLIKLNCISFSALPIFLNDVSGSKLA